VTHPHRDEKLSKKLGIGTTWALGALLSLLACGPTGGDLSGRGGDGDPSCATRSCQTNAGTPPAPSSSGGASEAGASASLAPDAGAKPAGGGGDSSHGSGGALGDSIGPCPDCRVHVPPSYGSGPMPLLVLLHGDEGRDGRAAATAGAIASFRAAADAAGFIVLAPACPASLGCDGAWSDWLASEGYHPSAASLSWLDAQVDAIESAYDVRTSGEYLAGTSGGAYWLGYYAQARADRFAGVAFVAGGLPAYTASNACPACKLPGYFLGGSGDYRTAGQMSDTARAFQTCGEATTLDLVTGDHEQTIASLPSGRASAILAWFEARPRACGAH
jgi:poly(3-hydroxybutyrate) depolymerase